MDDSVIDVFVDADILVHMKTETQLDLDKVRALLGKQELKFKGIQPDLKRVL